MSHYTKEDIIRIVEEEDVEFIRLQFVDIFGILKNMAVTAKQLDSSLMPLQLMGLIRCMWMNLF